MNGADPQTGVWVYAIGWQMDQRALPDLPGVDTAPVDLVRSGDLAAVVSPVGLDRFGADGLKRALNDLDQLEQIARAHHHVVQVVAERPVVPMRMATVYDDEESVHKMLIENSEAFRAALHRVEGRQEWGVKAFGSAPTSGSAEPTAPVSGADYLKRRQASLNAADESRRASSAEADTVYRTLAGSADAARRHRPQDPHLSGDRRPMLLNAAFLIESSAAGAFADVVEGLRDTHRSLDLELTGPWAPYSFATIEDTASVSPIGEPT
jgi:hypothetical protein